MRSEMAVGTPPQRFAALRRLYTEPFTLDVARLADLSVEEARRQQRTALAWLIISHFALLQAIGCLFSAVGHAPAAIIALQAGALGYTLLCLGLLAAGRATAASALYIYGIYGIFFGISSAILSGIFAPLLGVGLVSPSGLDLRSVVTFMFMAFFILLSGLLLPMWAIWLTAALGLGAVWLVVAVEPLAPQLRLIGLEAPRLEIDGFVALIFLGVALLAWFFARSAAGGTRAALQAARGEREMTALKDQFIVYVNHELRTPIMGLYGNVELIVKLGERATAAQRTELLQRALRSGDATLKLLQSVLDADVMKPSAIRVTPEAINLGEHIRDILAGFDPRELGEPGLEGISYAARDVLCEIPDTLTVYADPARLRQVLVNLLSNALKYSPPGSRIEITAGREAGRDPATPALARVRVRDYGLGVPPREAPKLFQRFVRLERDIAGSIRGTGVGLYLSRELIMAMGGQMWVESQGVAGEGSTFVFTVPVAPASTAPPGKVVVGEPAKPFVATDLAGRRVALADFAGQRVLLTFLRSASCPLCNARLWYLKQHYARFQERGLAVLVILESPPEATKSYTARLDLPFPIIPDGDRAIFHLYGVTASVWGLRGSARLAPLLRAALNGHFQMISTGSPGQLPADILLGADQRVRVAHYGQDVGDSLSLRDIDQFAARESDAP